MTSPAALRHPMLRRPLLLLAALAMLAMVIAAPRAQAQADASSALLNRSLYQLVDPAPLASLSPGFDAGWRLETAAGLGDRHQLRLSSSAYGLVTPFREIASRYDSRATWRYTVFERPGWSWRVGLTTPLGDRDPRLLAAERTRFGSLPLLHMAGEASLARRWALGVDADGLMTARGRAFELGVRVSYQLAPDFSLVGGARLTEAAGEGETSYAPGLAGSANVGLRLRF